MVSDNANIDRLIEQITSKKPDLVEFRLDNLREPRLLEEIARKKSFPAIATDMSGRGSATALELLAHAAHVGFEVVDVELTSGAANSTLRQLKSEGAEVILSYHDYAKTPSTQELVKVLEAEKQAGADICKVVTTASKTHDNLTVLSFVEEEASKTRLVSFAMGSLGVPSRVLSPLFGAEFTFASISPELRTAEGQLSIDELRGAWQILGIQGS
jgi:3-dehydroquinate dehydratase type I